jgi:hypothetical protein
MPKKKKAKPTKKKVKSSKKKSRPTKKKGRKVIAKPQRSVFRLCQTQYMYAYLSPQAQNHTFDVSILSDGPVQVGVLTTTEMNKFLNARYDDPDEALVLNEHPRNVHEFRTTMPGDEAAYVAIYFGPQRKDKKEWYADGRILILHNGRELELTTMS